MTTLTEAEVARQRLANLHLTSPVETPEDVLQSLTAVQCQNFEPGKWSVGQRVSGATVADVQEGFDEGRILRTHVLRPTWHLVLAEDVVRLQGLTGPRVRAVTAGYCRRAGLHDDAIHRSHAILQKELEGGKSLTREEIAACFQAAGNELSRFQLLFVLMEAELQAVIVSGPMKANKHTYALLAERVGTSIPRDRDDSLRELTVRYFSSHGPATARDYSWWSSLTLKDVKQGLELAETKLKRMECDGVTYWSVENRPGLPRRHAHLIEAYDELLVGYSESKYLVDLDGLARQHPGRFGIYEPSLVLDGQIVGHWRKEAVGDEEIVISIRPFRDLSHEEGEAVDVAVTEMGRFYARPIRSDRNPDLAK